MVQKSKKRVRTSKHSRSRNGTRTSSMTPTWSQMMTPLIPRLVERKWKWREVIPVHYYWPLAESSLF